MRSSTPRVYLILHLTFYYICVAYYFPLIHVACLLVRCPYYVRIVVLPNTLLRCVPWMIAYRSVLICLCPMITSLNLQKSPPCSGFVKKSASIFSVWQYSIFILFCSTLSFMKKYLLFICLDFFPHDCIPFFSIFIAL